MSLPTLKDAIASHTWYHTMELAPGVEAPGYYDLRPIVGALPWPDVGGKRCLDVATFDGFFAFELERRGASEVVAIDVDDYADIDWLFHRRESGPKEIASMTPGEGFRIASEALSSRVERRAVNVYGLSPDTVGTFDVVVCGSLLLHLRDPLRALEAIRSVCRGAFLSMESIRLGLTLLHRRRPLVEYSGYVDVWSVPNATGHAKRLELAGFEILKRHGPYAVPFGPAHREMTGGSLRGGIRKYGPRAVARAIGRNALAKAFAGGVGDVHMALLARPLA